MLAEVPDDDIGVFPWQLRCLALFFAADTQWRTRPGPGGAGTDRLAGLDYGAARVAWECLGLLPVTPDEFTGLRTMEAAITKGLRIDDGNQDR